MEGRGEESPYFADPSSQDSQLTQQPSVPLVAFESIDRLLQDLPESHPPTHPHQLPNPSAELLIESKRLLESRQHLPHPRPPSLQTPIKIRFGSKRLQQPVATDAPAPIIWRERRPFSRKVVSYEERVVRVPVERVETGFVEVEHIREFARRQVEEVRYEVEARERVDYRLQYLPVER
jgi:hypothetical protein